MTRNELIAQLTKVQNDHRNHSRDILTITGFMSIEQIERHLNAERARLTPVNLAA